MITTAITDTGAAIDVRQALMDEKRKVRVFQKPTRTGISAVHRLSHHHQRAAPPAAVNPAAKARVNSTPSNARFPAWTSPA